MFRAICWSCLQGGVDLTDEAAVGEWARSLNLVMGTDPEAPVVLVDGRDVSREILTLRVTTAVSHVATNPAVRAELRESSDGHGRPGPRRSRARWSLTAPSLAVGSRRPWLTATPCGAPTARLGARVAACGSESATQGSIGQ